MWNTSQVLRVVKINRKETEYGRKNLHGPVVPVARALSIRATKSVITGSACRSFVFENGLGEIGGRRGGALCVLNREGFPQTGAV